MVTAGKVTSRTEGLLTYRFRMTSRSGPAQTTYRARVILFPAPKADDDNSPARSESGARSK